MDDQPKKILVAEDNHVLADVLRFNLERAGLQVTVAYNGREAIEYLECDTYDLLVTDYQMPEVDGAELCQHVRQSMRLTELPIFMCSAKGLELDTEQLRDRWNVNKVVYKPFSMRELVVLVQSLITPREETSTSV